MLTFPDMYQIAAERLGSVELLEARMPETLSLEALAAIGDDRYLSTMSRRVFQAGLSHKMVNNKWPAFEELFFQFNPKRCAFMNHEEIETRMQDARLIRHLEKMKTIPLNALFIDDICREHESFGQWIADWPSHEIVDLWLVLKKKGARLGGMSGPRFLRMMGKDTFLLTDDVVAALVNYKIVDKKPTAVKALKEVQQRFLDWQQESGRPLAEVSRVLSLTVG